MIRLVRIPRFCIAVVLVFSTVAVGVAEADSAGLSPFVGVGIGPMVGVLRYWSAGGWGASVRAGVRGSRGFGVEFVGAWTHLYGGEGQSWRSFQSPPVTALWGRVGPSFDWDLGRQEISAALHVGLSRFSRYESSRFGLAAGLALGWEWKATSTLRLGLAISQIVSPCTYGGGSGYFVELAPQVRLIL